MILNSQKINLISLSKNSWDVNTTLAGFEELKIRFVELKIHKGEKENWQVQEMKMAVVVQMEEIYIKLA